MEFRNDNVVRRTNKRKLSEMCEEEGSRFPLNELNQDLFERVLSWLPTSSFFRLTTVCKRWKSAADSATFKLACSRVPSREPWFFMVDSQPQRGHQPIVFDSSEKNWKELSHPPLLQQNHNQDSSCSDFIPVTSSGGLLCFLCPDGDFIITNPVNAACRRVNSPFPDSQKSIRAIAMKSKDEIFNLILLSGELPNLRFRQYNSSTNQWEEDIALSRNIDSAMQSEKSDDCTQYFLSKCGNVVSTDIQRSPSKQYSSILTQKDGEEILHFLSSSGTVVACNLTRKVFFEYPRLLPFSSEYSIDLVECRGQMFVVLLSEFLETASLRVWSWDDINQSWKQITAMPPYMSHKFYEKKVDINCAGAGEEMFVCVNSAEICSYLMCNLVEHEWIELPGCCINGEAKEFVCAFSFEPRIEAST